MEFVNPGFLYGLLAVSIPVVIHLFNFRRFKKVYFTNVRFIREIRTETRRQSKLRHLLALLMRILAIVCIVMAFAQPYIPVSDQQAAETPVRHVSIYIDNSFSLNAQAEKGSLFNKAVETARDIAMAHGGGDLFQLLTNDFEGMHQRFVSRDQFISLLDEIEIAPAFRTFPRVVNRQLDLFESERAEAKSLFLISDFQRSFMDAPDRPVDSAASVVLVPLRSGEISNLYIDSCWFTAPVRQVNQQVSMKVRVGNTSDLSYDKIPIRLKIDGKQRAIASFDIAPRDLEEIALYFTNYDEGDVHGELEINDHPITFDDRLFFTYHVSPEIRVLVINGTDENPYLNSLLGNDSAFHLRNVNFRNIDYSGLGDYHLIILNEVPFISSGLSEEASRFVDRGGVVAIIPPWESDMGSYREFLEPLGTNYYTEADTAQRMIGWMNLEHEFFGDVFEEVPGNIDLPVVFSHWNLSRNIRSMYEVLLEMQGDDPFLVLHTTGTGGKLYLFASPLRPEFSTLPRHALFVPVIYRMALSGLSMNPPYYLIGRDQEIQVGNTRLTGDQALKIRSFDGDFEFIPGIRRTQSVIYLDVHEQVREAGNYRLFAGDRLLQGLAFNYDRRESELSFYSVDELQLLSEETGYNLMDVTDVPVSQKVEEFTSGFRLWKWFVIAALLFLALEGAILRFMK